MLKKLVTLRRDPDAHWVGDGFPVRTLFSYVELGEELSPFLLLDHAGPTAFPPSQTARGVGFHPHRGFETVTIVFQGELEHRDTAGNSGRIGPGDVQWMTAGSGVLHEEMHSREFSRQGGTLQMAQLWVNLPANQKMSAPRYQAIVGADIPSVSLSDGAGTVRVIAGDFAGAKGPARTMTPMDVWDVRLKEGARLEVGLLPGHTAALVVLTGAVLLNGEREAIESTLAVFHREGENLEVDAHRDALLLLLSGEPIREPIVGRGPFVMNTESEIRQAYRDFTDGRMGRLPA
jgi:quercetin 2,3-dioxygenase